MVVSVGVGCHFSCYLHRVRCRYARRDDVVTDEATVQSIALLAHHTSGEDQHRTKEKAAKLRGRLQGSAKGSARQ